MAVICKIPRRKKVNIDTTFTWEQYALSFRIIETIISHPWLGEDVSIPDNPQPQWGSNKESTKEIYDTQLPENVYGTAVWGEDYYDIIYEFATTEPLYQPAYYVQDVYSIDRNAYPDDGEQEGYWYKFIK